MEDNKIKCKLCNTYFDYSKMSEEHYPAKSVGNDDIVAIDIVKMLDFFLEKDTTKYINKRIISEENFQEIICDIFDNELSESIYPKGRTARTLCRKCNTFLGTFDEAYLKFFSKDGDPKDIKGFNCKTKIKIIKSIFGKFLSIPEAYDEDFDFVDFVRDDSLETYNGEWKLYFVRRNFNSDFMGFKNIETGKLIFDEGIVYELSDDKFIFNLLNFEKHECFKMNNIFEILNKNYTIIDGVGDDGGYHAQILMSNLFDQMYDEEDLI